MDILRELVTMQDDFLEVQVDNLRKRESRYFNRAMNRLMNLVADGERRVTQKGMAVIGEQRA